MSENGAMPIFSEVTLKRAAKQLEKAKIIHTLRGTPGALWLKETVPCM